MSEQLELLDQIVGIFLFFALLLHKPVKALHSAEIIDILGCLVNGIDQACYILLMLQAVIQRIFRGVISLVRFVYGFQGNAFAVVEKVCPHQHGVIAFFLRLDLIPVRKSVQSFILIIISKIKIQISGIEFLVDLSIDQLFYFGV